MAKNDSNIRIYGDEEATVWVAPKGTELPDDLAALAAPYADAGLLGEDGIEFEGEPETVEVRVHNGFRIARTKITGGKQTVKIVCSETNAITNGLMYPAAVVTTTAGVTRIDNKEKFVSDERVFVIEDYDVDIHTRTVITRGEVTERGTVVQKADKETIFEFTITSYGAIYTLTNDAALAVAAA
ncbi:hypothetical protein [Cryobacterium sp. SO1]|uniref:phage tail tube protein n=1 Tax=Cryobacterium sp. SO1 TaxID=1897061 RepID=UPI001022D7DE|nr:hypothetical protein [Cryobacterium sp. SO1]RZI35316.1 hypothetical protein BJQ95_02383 [Cryobacterium sp. SO1]